MDCNIYANIEIVILHENVLLGYCGGEGTPLTASTRHSPVLLGMTRRGRGQGAGAVLL